MRIHAVSYAIAFFTITSLSALAAPPEPKPLAPPPRPRAEVQAVLNAVQTHSNPTKLKLLRIVLVAGPKDHGRGEHDYPAWQKRWEPLLAKAPGVSVSTAFGKPDAKVWELADLMVFYCWGPQFWDDSSYPLLDRFFARGGGVVIMHSAAIAKDEPQKLADRIGLAWTPQIKYRHGEHDLTFTGRSEITAGFKALHVVDEDYWPPQGRNDAVHVLATTPDDGKDWPMIWTYERGKGRAFSTILGHYTWTWEDPLVRILILRGMAWAAGEPIDRFQSLATAGVPLHDGAR